ncbi:MAG: hypothetical protein JXQ80_08785 [Bacteroidales bacterium]|nr:hypothetical protein [Bacteroidales bacterium]
MKKPINLIILLLVSIMGNTQPVLLFKSGFEEGTEIVKQGNAHVFRGKDISSGFCWDKTNLKGSMRFFYLAGEEPERYISTRIEKVPGRDGMPTNALYMAVKGDLPDDNFGVVTRNEFSFFPDTAFHEGYVSFWMKLQGNLTDVAPNTKESKQLSYYGLDSWRMIMEIKEPNSGVSISGRGTNNFRISFFIARDSVTGNMYWLLRAEMPQPVRKIDWEIANREVEVPIGEWFKMEAYFKKDRENGRVWWSVNGHEIADYHGRTEHPDTPLPVKFWSFFKLYQDEKWFEKGEVYQWIDDFEFWDGFPEGHVKVE